MSEFAGHVSDYLRMRRALGFKLEFAGQVLPQLVAYLDAAGATTLTVDLAVAWAQLPQGVHPVTWNHRLGAVRGFAAYLKTIDAATQIPPADVFAGQGPRPSPYLWSDSDIVRLVQAAGDLKPKLRGATLRAVLGLLAVSGMRIGEVLAVDCDDLDVEQAILTVAEGKYHRQRLIPLHPSTLEALCSYATLRDGHPRATPTAMFVSWRDGTRLSYGAVAYSYKQLTDRLALRTPSGRPPRIHDLRHAFAVRTLIDWHRAGHDIHRRMPQLSDYLGHVNPEGTYWYLTACPELMGLAAQRLEAPPQAGPT